MFSKSNKLLSLISLLIAIPCIYLYKNPFFKAALYGLLVSFINILSIQFLTNIFTKKKASKVFAFLFTISKILLLVGVVIYLIKFLTLDLIGFLTGFSVILIVFILLIQGK